MARNELEIILRLRDEARRGLEQALRALGKLEHEMEQLQRTGRNLRATLASIGQSFDQLSANLPALFGSGGLLYALKAVTDEAFRADAALRVFRRTVEAFGGDAQAAEQALSDVATKLGLVPQQIADSAAQLLRAGFSMEQIVAAFEAGAASALAAGRSAAEGVENVAMALATGQSIYLNYIGIAENIGPVLQKVASSMKGASEEAIRAAQNQAALNVILKATEQEVASLDILLGGYAGAVNKVSRDLYELRVRLGEDLLPLMTSLAEALDRTLNLLEAIPGPLRNFAVGAAAAASAATLLGAALGGLRIAFGALGGPAGLIVGTIGVLGGLGVALAGTRREVDPTAEAVRQIRTEIAQLRSEIEQASSVDELITKLEALGETLTGPALDAWTQYVEQAKKSKQEIRDISAAAEEAIAKFLAVQKIAVEQTVEKARKALVEAVRFSGLDEDVRARLAKAARKGGDAFVQALKAELGKVNQAILELDKSFDPISANILRDRKAALLQLENALRPLIAAEARLNALRKEERRILEALKRGGTGAGGPTGQGRETGGTGSSPDVESLKAFDAWLAKLRVQAEQKLRPVKDILDELAGAQAKLAARMRELQKDGLDSTELQEFFNIADQLEQIEGLIDRITDSIKTQTEEVQLLTDAYREWQASLLEARAPDILGALKPQLEQLRNVLDAAASAGGLERLPEAMQQAGREAAAKLAEALASPSIPESVKAVIRPVVEAWQKAGADAANAQFEAYRRTLEGRDWQRFSIQVLRRSFGTREQALAWAKQAWGAVPLWFLRQLDKAFPRGAFTVVLTPAVDEAALREAYRQLQESRLQGRRVQVELSLAPDVSALRRAQAGILDVEAARASAERLRKALGNPFLAVSEEWRRSAEQLLEWFDGQMAEFAETAQRHAEAVANLRFGDGFEASAQAIRRSFDDATEAMRYFLRDGRLTQQEARLLEAAFGELPPAVAAVADGLDDLRKAFRLGLISGDQYKAKLEQARETLQRLLQTTKEGTPAWEQYRDALLLVEDLLDRLPKTTDAAVDATQRLTSALLVAKGVFQDLDEVWRSFGRGDVVAGIEGIGKVVGRIGKELADTFQVIPVAGDVVAAAADSLFGMLSRAVDIFERILDTGAAAVTKRFREAAKGMTLIGEGVFEAARERYEQKYLFGLIRVTKERVNEAMFELIQAVANALDQGVVGALKNAMKKFLEGAQDWMDALREGIRDAIENAIVEAVIQGAVIKGALGKLLEDLTNALAQGQYDAARQIVGQIAAQIPEIAAGIQSVLEPMRQSLDAAFGRSGGAGESGSSAPGVTTIRYELPTAPVMGAPSWVDEMGRHIDRFGEAVDRFAKARITVDVRTADAADWGVRYAALA